MFCDFSTPGKSRFNVYDDIRDKLMNRGVPGEEIAFIHGADTEQKKEALFAKVRSGTIRILMGSTQKMGAGTNVQDRLVASHDLDCPWRPADLEQRAGRIIRQGNRNPEVTIYRYVTESSFDSYLYQTIEAKQRFISQIMTSKTPLRSCEDVDESVLSYAEVKALCIGDPRIKEKMELDIDVSKLKLLEASFRNEHFDLQDKLRRSLPNAISNTEKRIRLLEEDAETAEATMGKDFRITILDETFGLDRDGKARKLDAGKALLAAVRSLGMSDGTIGEYRGFRMSFSFDPLAMKVDLKLTGAAVHDVELGDSATGNLARMDNAIDGISDRLRTAKRRLAELHSQVSAAEEELKREFPRAQELKEKSARLAQLNAELTLQERKPIPTEGENKPDGEAVLRPVAPVAPDFVKSVNF